MSLPIPEIPKRSRDTATESLIQQALEEEQQKKRRKKGYVEPGVQGKTLAEIEDDEGGTVKESMVGMAHTKRALARKKGKAGLGDVSTDLVDVEEVEEEEPDQEALEDLLGPGAIGGTGTDGAAAAAAAGVGMGEHPGGRRIISDDDEAAAAAAAGADRAAADEKAAAAGAEEEEDKGFDRADLGPGAAGGYGLTAFNLKSEREEGYFDQEGNYVFNKDDDEDGGGDPWLASEGALAVSDKVRAAAEAAAAAAAAADAAPLLSETQVAVAQRELAGLLQPEESVAQALRRLGAISRPSKAKRKKHKASGSAAAAAGPEPMATAPPPEVSAAAAAFSRITELADLLLNAGGELDVYSQRKEQLQRWSDAILPKAAPQGAAGEEEEEDGFDFGRRGLDFGTEGLTLGVGIWKYDEKPAAPAKQPTSAAGASRIAAAEPLLPPAPAAVAAGADGCNGTTPVLSTGRNSAAGGAPASSTAAAASGSAEGVDYSSWPIKELRRFCAERGVDTSKLVEKAELVTMVQELAAQGPEGEPAAAAAGAVPEGYVYDPSSGYYYSSSSGMYWDAKSGGYYNAGDGKWYSWDAAVGHGQFVAWV